MIDSARQIRDPIFVRATGSGSAGIATLILDGDDVSVLLKPFLRIREPLSTAVSGDLMFGRVIDAAGRMIDEVLLAPLGRKNTSTGNEQIELSCHGGEGAIAAVEETLRHAGFSAGRPTELLERAHLKGKLSLIAIESRLRLPLMATARQAEFLFSHGKLQQHWERLGLEMAMGMRYSDETWRAKLRAEASAAGARYASAEKLLAQHHVAIIGPVNAGKSTLVNALARAERHIVSDIPGTTLDRLDTPIDLRGLNVVLSDTAGLRNTNDDIEREGQLRGQSAATEAALRLLVLDGSHAPAESDVALLKQTASTGPTLLVLNKEDLGTDENAAGLGFLLGCDAIAVSAKSGSGTERLLDATESALLGSTSDLEGAPFTKRQQNLLHEIECSLLEQREAGLCLPFVRRLVGTRPDPAELATVLAEEL